MFRKLAFALALCLVCVSAAQAADKIGVVDVMGITGASDAGKAAEKELQNRFGSERSQLEKMNTDLDKKAQDLSTQAATLSDKAREDRRRDIENGARQMEDKARAYTERLNSVQTAITTQMQEVVNTACQNVARKGGYNLIIDSATVLFADGAVNITEQVITEMNAVWKTKGGKFSIK